ncbi:hypothetical protein AB9D59_17510 [Blautia producta]|uniref:hypothetical protein n=1 Tax=Blautia producta TaxID=33035 RepID=UPI000497E503
MNNQNYRQNFKNSAGKPGTDEQAKTRAGGPRYPQGVQQPYHAGPQPGSQTESQPYQNNTQQRSGTYQNNAQQGPGTFQNNSQQGPGTFQNNSQQGPGTFQNRHQQGPGTFQNSPQQGPGTFQNNSQQGPGTFQNNSQQGPGPYQNNSQQGSGTYQNGPQQGPGPYQNNPQQGAGPYQNNAQQGTGSYQSGPRQDTQQQGNPQDNWMNNPNLKGMDPEKLKMLNNIASQGSQKGMNELLPFLMSAVSQNKSQSGGLDFSRQEMDTIIEVLKMGKSPEEVARINRMMQIVKMMH